MMDYPLQQNYWYFKKLTGEHKRDIVELIITKRNKMSKLLKMFKTKKVGEVQAELGRAHLIIALLAFVAIVLLVQQTAIMPELDSVFSTMAIVLLSVLATISLTIALLLRNLRKK